MRVGVEDTGGTDRISGSRVQVYKASANKHIGGQVFAYASDDVAMNGFAFSDVPDPNAGFEDGGNTEFQGISLRHFVEQVKWNK